MNTTLALGSTFALGALHALEPGHGKSFLAAYTLGGKLKLKHVLALGGSMLISHFLLLVIIAFALQWAFSHLDDASIMAILRWVVPVAIIGFGAFLFWKGWTQKEDEHNCGCAHHHHDHNHEGHHHHEHKKHNHLAATEADTGWRSAAFVGMLTGFIPCPTAIVPVMLSGATSNFSQALFYLFVYVLGMSLVLMSLVISFYFAKDFLSSRFDNWSKKINPQLISAVLVLTVGVVYLAYQIIGHSH